MGEGPEGWLDVVDGRLISVYWWTAEDVRRRLVNPESALLTVRSWRDGVLIHDPTGVGAELQQEARDWSWEKIEREADEWVADKLVMWAEYLPKLAGALEGGRLLDCAALRSRITLQLAELFAVHRRLIEESENGFWETVADAGGDKWRAALERALGVEVSEAEAASGAVELFELLADDVTPLLDNRQQSVVDHALASRSRA